jgi:methionyl-tRNA formyltransferase
MSSRFIVCAVGLKGATFLDGLIRNGLQPSTVVTYRQPDDRSNGFEKISELARQIEADLVEAKKPKTSENDLVFLIGWQYFLENAGPYTIVFHDSLLPRYRGFAPTVAALINGEATIGVTALRAADRIDEGPIIAQASAAVTYPMRIAEALGLQARLMADLAGRVHEAWLAGNLEETIQDESQATYSLWRDDSDYLIDWSQPAGTIARFVDAVGYPYSGARTCVGSDVITVLSATPIADLKFEHRQPGKVWAIEHGRPVVVCGAGMLRLDDCRTGDGTPYVFRKLRTRLGPSLC